MEKPAEAGSISWSAPAERSVDGALYPTNFSLSLTFALDLERE
jgi:hypothetical protein